MCAAGPLTAINGPHPIGSLVATWGDDSNAVLAWAAEDPYAKAGLFAEVKAPSYIARDVTGLYVLQNPSVPVDLFGLDQAEEAAAAGAEDEKKTKKEINRALRTPPDRFIDRLRCEDTRRGCLSERY